MKRLPWINVVLLVGVITLALFAYFQPPTAAPNYRLSMLTAADAKSIKIEASGAPPIVLERSGAEWKIDAPLAARADDFQVQRILAVLGATAEERLPATDLARFDLAPPALTLTIDGQTFGFGIVNALTREQYVLTRNEIYLTRPGYGMAVPAWQLISRQLFAENETPTAFEFPNFKLAQQNGKWMLSPSPKTALSQDDFNRWIDNWHYASALAVQPAGKRTGVTTIQVKFQGNHTVKLAVLQRVPQLVLTRDDQPAFEYQFTDDVSQQLLTPPGTPLKSQINTDEHR
jgi:hypothetical protein